MKSVYTVAALLIATSTLAAQSPVTGAKPPAPAQTRPFPRIEPLPFPQAPQVEQTLTQAIRVVPVVTGLANPWSLAFLPNGDLLVTEKPGRLRLVRGGVLQAQPLAGGPVVHAVGQGGLLEVALHPRFAENQFIYLTYSKPGERGNTTALWRGRFNGTAIVDGADVFVADAWSTGTAHFGSKIAFGQDGTLYMTVGERNDRMRAQDTTHHAGKVLRLKDDGTVPADNPFVGRAGFKPEIYSYGHRNLQGLAIHPDTGALWETEHGPQGGDELNQVLPGRNYGWPVVTLGREYTGDVISGQAYRDGMESPYMVWVPSIALSGMVFYTGDKFPEWRGNLFVGGLAGQQLQRVAFTPKGGTVGRESLIAGMKQRIRDVRQGPDGLLYLAVDGNPGGILRIEPAAAGPTGQ